MANVTTYIYFDITKMYIPHGRSDFVDMVIRLRSR